MFPWLLPLKSEIDSARPIATYAIFGASQAIFVTSYDKFDILMECRSFSIMSLILTPTLCKAARTLLGLSQEELAKKADVSLRSLTRFENADTDASAKVRDKLYRAFANADLQFIAANSDTDELDGVGIRFKPKLPNQGIKVL